MAFAMKIKSLKNYVDLKTGVKIYVKEGKNYLERNGKTFELPSGIISMEDSKIFIDGKSIDPRKYV